MWEESVNKSMMASSKTNSGTRKKLKAPVLLCKQSPKNSYKMMPVEECLEIQRQKPPPAPPPPGLVIDESTINSAIMPMVNDVGPVCGCDEKFDFVKRYKPFVVGGVNPYNRRKIPDTDSLKIYWKQLKIGERDLIYEIPVAMNPSEVPHDFSPSSTLAEHSEDDFFLKQPRYTEAYLKKKLKQCSREHSEICKCPGKKKHGADGKKVE